MMTLICVAAEWRGFEVNFIFINLSHDKMIQGQMQSWMKRISSYFQKVIFNFVSFLIFFLCDMKFCDAFEVFLFDQIKWQFKEWLRWFDWVPNLIKNHSMNSGLNLKIFDSLELAATSVLSTRISHEICIREMSNTLNVDWIPSVPLTEISFNDFSMDFSLSFAFSVSTWTHFQLQWRHLLDSSISIIITIIATIWFSQFNI